MPWTPKHLPDLRGKTYVITGGNSGLGLAAAKILAGKGGRVVITARSAAKAEAALSDLRVTVSGAEADYVLLDLSEPGSIMAASDALHAKCPCIDAFINNAGVMQTPEIRTSEGFELQLATNHLGHFRLNAKMMDVLEASDGRIVPVSSLVHLMANIEIDDLQSRRAYNPSRAYGQSKLANLLYAFELQRRLERQGSRVSVYPCHPGYAATNLQSSGVSLDGGGAAWRLFYAISNVLAAQTPEQGAYALVLAAADPQARAGVYYGPTRLWQSRGPVGESRVAAKARDEVLARKLWEKTEEFVGPFFATPSQ